MRSRWQRWADSPIGRIALAGRPVPTRSDPTAEPGWQTDAQCSAIDETTTFVITEAEAQNDIGHGDMRQLCWQCPVAYQCLTEGVVSRGYGLWGGVVLVAGRPAPVNVRRSGSAAKAA